jgi:3-phenylpropionate/trans-cinnamate dioxygenase ferredoxin reductase subunit
MNVNIKGVPEQIKALIAGGRQVDRDRLADPAVPLEEVLAR